MFSSSCHLVSLLPKHHKLIFYGRSYKNEWQLLPTPLCPAMEKEVCSRVCIVSMLTFAFIDIQVASCWGKGLLFATWGREEEAKTVAGIMVWGGVLLCRCMGLWCSKQKVALHRVGSRKLCMGLKLWWLALQSLCCLMQQSGYFVNLPGFKWLITRVPVTARDGLEDSGGNFQTCIHWLLIPSTNQFSASCLQCDSGLFHIKQVQSGLMKKNNPRALYTWWGYAETHRIVKVGKAPCSLLRWFVWT